MQSNKHKPSTLYSMSMFGVLLLGSAACLEDAQGGDEVATTDQEIRKPTGDGGKMDFVLGKKRLYPGSATKPGLDPFCSGGVGRIPGLDNTAFKSNEHDFATTAKHCIDSDANAIAFQNWEVTNSDGDKGKVLVEIASWQTTSNIGTKGDVAVASICPALLKANETREYPDAKTVGADTAVHGNRNSDGPGVDQNFTATDWTKTFTKSGTTSQITTTLFAEFDSDFTDGGDSGSPYVKGGKHVGVHRGIRGGKTFGTWVTKAMIEGVWDGTQPAWTGDTYDTTGDSAQNDDSTKQVGAVVVLGCYKTTVQAKETNNIDKITATGAAGTIGEIPPGGANPLIDNAAATARTEYPSFPPDGKVTLTATPAMNCTFQTWTLAGVAGATCKDGLTTNPCEVKFPINSGGNLTVSASATCACSVTTNPLDGLAKTLGSTAISTTICVPPPPPPPGPTPEPTPTPTPTTDPTPTPIPDPTPLPTNPMPSY